MGLKTLLLLGLVMSLCIIEGQSLRFKRETEREGNGEVPTRTNSDSNDVNTDRDTPAENPIAGADDGDDWDDFGDEGQGFFLSWNPFRHSFQDMFTEFRRMQTVMDEMQERIMNLTMNIPKNYDNRTSEVITVNGKRYNVTRTVVQRGDQNNTSFLFSATSIVQADKRRKREVPLVEALVDELHRKKRDSEDESGSEEDDG